MYRLSKKFRFETAHRLAKGYEGKCKNPHGHSWNGEIEIECTDTDKYDFAMDFSDLKKFTKSIEDQLDHGMMLYKEDTELIALHFKNEWKVVVFDKNPTCETIAEWIFEQAIEWLEGLESSAAVRKVVIEETCTSRCEYYG